VIFGENVDEPHTWGESETPLNKRTKLGNPWFPVTRCQISAIFQGSLQLPSETKLTLSSKIDCPPAPAGGRSLKRRLPRSMAPPSPLSI
jgi:hypothetical protein